MAIIPEVAKEKVEKCQNCKYFIRTHGTDFGVCSAAIPPARFGIEGEIPEVLRPQFRIYWPEVHRNDGPCAGYEK